MVNAVSLMEAIKHGDKTLVERVVAEEPALADIQDENGVSTVLTALYHNEPTIAFFLAAAKKQVNFFEAAALGDTNRMEEIQKSTPVKINAFSPDGFQALGYACFFNHEQAVRYLLDHGAEVNTPSRNSFGVYPLHSAAAAKNVKIVELLLQAGADPNVTQSGDYTALHTAAVNGQVDMIHLLLQFGASIYAVNREGKTPKQLAIANGHGDASAIL